MHAAKTDEGAHHRALLVLPQVEADFVIPLFAGLHLLPPLSPLPSSFFHSPFTRRGFFTSQGSLFLSLSLLCSPPSYFPHLPAWWAASHLHSHRPSVLPMILSRMSRNNSPLSVLIFCSHLFQVIHVHLEDHHSVRKRSIDQNLRIKLYYDESVYK